MTTLIYDPIHSESHFWVVSDFLREFDAKTIVDHVNALGRELAEQVGAEEFETIVFSESNHSFGERLGGFSRTPFQGDEIEFEARIFHDCIMARMTLLRKTACSAKTSPDFKFPDLKAFDRKLPGYLGKMTDEAAEVAVEDSPNYEMIAREYFSAWESDGEPIETSIGRFAIATQERPHAGPFMLAIRFLYPKNATEVAYHYRTTLPEAALYHFKILNSVSRLREATSEIREAIGDFRKWMHTTQANRSSRSSLSEDFNLADVKRFNRDLADKRVAIINSVAKARREITSIEANTQNFNAALDSRENNPLSPLRDDWRYRLIDRFTAGPQAQFKVDFAYAEPILQSAETHYQRFDALEDYLEAREARNLRLVTVVLTCIQVVALIPAMIADFEKMSWCYKLSIVLLPAVALSVAVNFFLNRRV